MGTLEMIPHNWVKFQQFQVHEQNIEGVCNPEQPGEILLNTIDFFLQFYLTKIQP